MAATLHILISIILSIPVDVCDNLGSLEFCKNGGSCMVSESQGVACSCKNGTSGFRCETALGQTGGQNADESKSKIY